MKYKTTQKEVMNGFQTVISCGYCSLQFLLRYETPSAYTSGADGWKADIYDMGNGIALVTGYAPFGSRVPYEITKKYDSAAQKFLYPGGGKNPRAALRRMIGKMLKEIGV